MNARRSNVMAIPVERNSSIFEKVQGSSSLGLRHMRPPLSRIYYGDRERTLIEPRWHTSFARRMLFTARGLLAHELAFIPRYLTQGCGIFHDRLLLFGSL